MDGLWVGLGTMLGTWTLTYFGGKKASHELRQIVDQLCDDVWEIKERLNIPQRPRKSGNGHAEVGLADPLAHLVDERQRKERA